MKQMNKTDRMKELKELFDTVEEEQQKLAAQLLEDAAFLEEQLIMLKGMPFIRVHPDKPELQKRTEASRLYKECIQSYCNVVKILNGILRKNAIEESDEFDEFSKEFGV